MSTDARAVILQRSNLQKKNKKDFEAELWKHMHKHTYYMKENSCGPFSQLFTIIHHSNIPI